MSIRKKVLACGFLLLVFLAGFSVWYSPVLFKGYAPYKMTEIMPIAKNLSQTGKFSMEDRQSIFLPTSLINEKGEIATSGNKLSARLYAALFKVFGVLGPNQLVMFSAAINSLSIAIFAFIVLSLFGFGMAGLFSAIYIFIPYNWESVYSLGTYEFSIFFIALFFLFFLLGRGKRHEMAFLSISAIFLVLASFSREVFFLLISIIPAFFWFSGKKRHIIYFLAPIVLAISVFYLPSFFGKGGGNSYSSSFFAEMTEKQKFMDSTFYEHLYPDPYTYHFEKKEFLYGHKEKIDKMSFVEKLLQKKTMANLGIGNIGLIDRFLLGVVLLFTHLSRFFSLEIFGGTFPLMFSLMGLYAMKKKDKEFYKFSIYWLGGTMFLLSFVVLVSRSHLRDFNWLFPLLASLGIIFLWDVIKDKLNISGKSGAVLLSAIPIIFIYHLVLVDHVVFGKVYDGNPSLTVEAYADKIKEKNIGDEDVIAIGLNSKEEIVLSYLADKSMVIFTPNTVKKLMEEKKLREIFDNFGVKYFLGYDDKLSLEISTSTKAENIASKTIKVKQPAISPLKSLFMGLVR